MPARAEWQPVKGEMMTQWGRALKADAAWQEYPRPQLERADWTNLNGLWDYAVAGKESPTPVKWDGQILVPFCPESSLSGVGFTPFSFDITPALKADGNELVVRVDDATAGFQLHGKQKLKNGGIWYTRVTGIWQTVWLENVSERFIQDLDFTTDIKTGGVTVDAKLSGMALAGEKIRVTASSAGQQVAGGNGATPLALVIPAAKLWSPTEPNLYDLKVELLDAAGKVIDEVKSYVALREFGKVKDANGNWRFTLNGKSIFHWGPLDQGWWPDGLLTPPSEAAMISDIDFPQSRRLQHDPQAHQDRAAALLRPLRQDRHADVAGPSQHGIRPRYPTTRLESAMDADGSESHRRRVAG